MQNTHETYIQMIRDLVLETADLTDDEASRLRHTKMVYGLGDGSYRGVTVYKAWQNGVGNVDVIEIAATGEESYAQLAGTVIHELGHVLVGSGVGHSNEWKEASVRLGFTKRPAAAGQRYYLAMIDPRLRAEIVALAESLADGSPEFARMTFPGIKVTPRPCSAGTGTRGGKSRGKGSGSRLRLWECGCTPKPVKLRVASDDLDVTCNVCGSVFQKVEK